MSSNTFKGLVYNLQGLFGSQEGPGLQSKWHRCDMVYKESIDSDTWAYIGIIYYRVSIAVSVCASIYYTPYPFSLCLCIYSPQITRSTSIDLLSIHHLQTWPLLPM